MASGAPKDVLVDPARFGRLPDASLRPWDPTSSAAWGIVTRALAQHRLACAVSGHLRATRMTQARLAAAIGRRPGTLSKQLNGHDWMAAEDVCAIAHALGRIDWLDVRHLQSALRDAAEGSPPHGGGRGPAGRVAGRSRRAP